VAQEIYGLLIAHFVLRKLAFEAAAEAGVSPRLEHTFKETIQLLTWRYWALAAKHI
jgi:hypothetical protein